MENNNHIAGKWDLTVLYSGPDDPRIELDLQSLKIRTQDFTSKYRDAIMTAKIDRDSLKTAIDEYETIHNDLAKPLVYFSLRFATDADKPETGAQMQAITAKAEEIGRNLIFFEVGLMDLPVEKLQEFAHDEKLAKRSHYLQRIIDAKPHHLTEAEEKTVSRKSLTGHNAFVRLFDQQLSVKEFRVLGTEGPLNESQVLQMLYAPEREQRKNAAESLTAGLKDLLPLNTFILNMLALDKSSEDKTRNFSFPEQSRHLDNETNKEAVEAMIEATKESYSLVKDYYSFKKNLLGLDELHDYDRYAPITAKTEKIGYQEAVKIVLESFNEFDSGFADKAEMFFKGNWIDALPKQGKRGGAFCQFGTPDTHPFVMLNYQGALRDVETMAHELGHGVHALLANKQGYLEQSAPLSVCETASIFGEMLVFDKLKELYKNDKKALLSLYTGKIEEIIAAVHRQTAMHLFEADLHNRIAQGMELQEHEISSIWRLRQDEMFGGSVTLTKDYDIWWSYIPHFYHTPFYVYAYTFGELATLSVYQAYKENGKQMVSAYLDMLSAGGSEKPEILFAKLGLDINSDAFWKKGLAFIDGLLAEAKRLKQ